MTQIVGVSRLPDQAHSPQGHPHVSLRDFVREVGAPVICGVCHLALRNGSFLLLRPHKCEVLPR